MGNLGELGKAARDRHFGDLGDLAYLNSASMGVPPASAVEALRAEVAQWASGRGDFGRWEGIAERARERVAPLFGLEARDVALLPSYSVAASLIARALPEATVVVPEEEFRSNLMPWLDGRERVRLVPAPATTDAICAAIDGDTGLVAVSSVQSATGLRVDLPRLVAHAHANGALVHVDASQSLGVDTTLATCGADFIGSVAYKWILGSRGAGFLAVRPEHRGSYAPAVLSPSAATDFADGAFYGADYTLWADARRFDQPQAWFPWISTNAGLEVITSYDQAELEAHATGLATRFRDGAVRLGLTPAPVDVPSAIVAVGHPDADAAVARLGAAGVRASARNGGIRFAFHLYNTDDDVDRALTALG
ncbi:MAG TPA: aminotransferase class V-fold PLP-dependent enzyme [Streptosporangiaceae bacterium]|jgi:selenocysteine lyase/cysteine desulfurase